MGVLEDAIREHLDLKRKHGAPEDEVEQKELEALGPARREFQAPAEEAPADDDTPAGGTEAVTADEADEPVAEEHAEPEPEHEPPEPEKPPEEPELGAPEVTRLHDPPSIQPTLASQDLPDFASELDEEDEEQGEAPEKKSPQDWDFD